MTDLATLATLRDQIKALETGSREAIDLFEERFIPEPMSGCWLWIGTAFANGTRQRPLFFYRGVRWMAHRAAVVLYRGPFSLDAHICHRCDTPMCVNPDHLYVGDHQSNMRDMARRKRSYFARNPEIAHAAGLVIGYANDWSGGERNPKAKLTAEQVAEIRASRNTPSKVLAAAYGIDPCTVYRILKGQLWPVETLIAKEEHHDEAR